MFNNIYEKIIFICHLCRDYSDVAVDAHFICDDRHDLYECR